MIVDSNKTIRELSRINKVHETKVRRYCVRFNPMLAFIRSASTDEIRKSIIRKYIVTKNCELFLSSIKEFNRRFTNDWTRISRNKFMKFLLLSNYKARMMFTELTSKYSSWDLASELNLTQHSIRIICSEINLKISTNNSSKVHLRMKPIIEKALGYETSSEYFIKVNSNKYYIDEYCEDLKLCIEIDGEWCHSKDKDIIKDNDLKSLGLRVIRIPSTTNLSNLYDLVSDKLRAYSSVG